MYAYIWIRVYVRVRVLVFFFTQYGMNKRRKSEISSSTSTRAHVCVVRNQNITVEQESVMTEQSHIHRICPVSYSIKYESCSNCVHLCLCACNVVAACDCQHIAIPFALKQHSNKLFPLIPRHTNTRTRSSVHIAVARVYVCESQKYKGVTYCHHSSARCARDVVWAMRQIFRRNGNTLVAMVLTWLLRRSVQ